MSRENDRIADDIACLDRQVVLSTLVSTVGFNCEVWQSSGVIDHDGDRTKVDFVIKRHRFACDLRRLHAYRRDYRRLREALEEMVPSALFVATRINGQDNMIVLAQAHTPWFDLARIGNDDEARPLLEQLPRAKAQLARFVRVARAWADQGRVIDLYGRENLVLTRQRNVCYLDSFGVFFYDDMRYAVAGIDDEYQERIDISLQRLGYLQTLVT
jgi:hypothetical protein